MWAFEFRPGTLCRSHVQMLLRCPERLSFRLAAQFVIHVAGNFVMPGVFFPILTHGVVGTGPWLAYFFLLETLF